MLKWPSEQPVRPLAFGASPDYVPLILIVAESVDDDCASVGKDGLNLKRAAHGVDIIAQRAEIHIRPTLDARDRALGHVQHLGHVGLGELLGAAEFIESHSLQLVAHAL